MSTLLRHLVGASILTSCGVAFGQASFTGLGQPLDYPNSYATGVSADGSTVVGYGPGFRWTRAGGFQFLQPYPGTVGATAQGISGDGNVVAGWGSAPTNSHAFSWTGDGPVRDLGTLGGSNSYAMAVSSDGSALVGWAAIAGGNYHAFRATAAGMANLGILQGTSESYGFGVNADGSVVVGHSFAGGSPVAFRWTDPAHGGTGMVSLGRLLNSASSVAYGVSRDGSIVVGGSTTAFRWTVAEGMVSLGTLEGGLNDKAEAVSDDGSVIVGQVSGPGGSHAFMWTPSTGMVDIQTHLASLGLDMSGWQLSEATGISADGRTIVGNAGHNAHNEAWIAVLPLCGSADFDGDGEFATDLDIEAFFACIAGNCCPTCGSADFNGDGDIATDADIEAFFRVLAGGSC
jgi:probable HAF family extracellular repeat protein